MQQVSESYHLHFHNCLKVLRAPGSGFGEDQQQAVFSLFEPAAFARAHTHSGSGSTPSMQQYNGGILVEAVYLDPHLPLLSIHLPSNHSQVCVHYSL